MKPQIGSKVTKNTLVHRVVSVGFLTLLLIPLGLGIIELGSDDSSLAGENRNKEVWPEISLLKTDVTRYTAQINRFMSDHVGLRDTLINLHAKFQYRLLNKAISDKAVIAKNGWLFYSERDALKNPSEQPTFGEREGAAWLEPMLDYQRFIERRGGKLVVVLVPEKHHVYSEYLPSSYQYTRDGRRADVIERLAKRSGLTVINLLNSMLAEKGFGKLYLKSDSHWTQRGAYIAYRELITTLQQRNENLPFNSWDKLEKMESVRGSGDLAALLNLSDEFEEEYERYIPVHKQQGVNIDTANRPSLLLVGDSFSARLNDFLPSSFVGTFFVHHNFRSLPTDVVAKRRPDIVVIEIIDRALGAPFEVSER
ncbi:MAG: hypothetical protein JKX81_05930 [Arenicella sp.]|nr:hypothetical protein [Arenicella sp.]